MASWPDATNTGVPAGVTLTPSGGMVVTQDGAVIDGLDVHGSIYVQANNVTIKNCSITSSDFAVVSIKGGVTGTVVQNCEIDGQNAGGQGISGSGTFLQNNIHGVADGINVGGNNVTIENNYIHDLGGTSDSHYDGIQVDGGVDNLTIDHNTVINDHGQTSAVMIDDYFGPVNHVTVNDNILDGGGYTIYVTGDNGNGTQNVSVTNNHMGEGQYGYTDFVATNPIYTGNVNDGDSLAATLGQQTTSGSTTTTSGTSGDPTGTTTGTTSGDTSGSTTGGTTSTSGSTSSTGTSSSGSTSSGDWYSTHTWGSGSNWYSTHTWGGGTTSGSSQTSTSTTTSTTPVVTADDTTSSWHGHTESTNHLLHGHDFIM